ncbi:hypothetical protein Nepgr_008283 [Nepenthes gracilis]|uniref:Uncharacterized protein n=1 Tax=Nepenthes gracilis TaxID=150966 RepID=A0AAD3S8P6_NEPGR|nr:hypothetical protein Nepgr_008283 [Nepenthes gracilis]
MNIGQTLRDKARCLAVVVKLNAGVDRAAEAVKCCVDRSGGCVREKMRHGDGRLATGLVATAAYVSAVSAFFSLDLEIFFRRWR